MANTRIKISRVGIRVVLSVMNVEKASIREAATKDLTRKFIVLSITPRSSDQKVTASVAALEHCNPKTTSTGN